MTIIDQLFSLFRTKGQGAYFGEAVTEREHALQCAHLAEKSGANPENIAEQGRDARHEEGGADWLVGHFGPAVVDPVRLHVAAKRYMCAIEPGYLLALSPSSQLSLRLQGGPFNPHEVARFEKEPWFRSAVAVRRWDDEAKVPGLVVPDLDHYRGYLEAVLVRKG
jgi:predicted HD phosphohydrolase